MENNKKKIVYNTDGELVGKDDLFGWITPQFYVDFARGDFLYFDTERKIIIKTVLTSQEISVLEYLFSNNQLLCRISEITSYIERHDGNDNVSDQSIKNTIANLRKIMRIQPDSNYLQTVGRGKNLSYKLEAYSPADKEYDEGKIMWSEYTFDDTSDSKAGSINISNFMKEGPALSESESRVTGTDIKENGNINGNGNVTGNKSVSGNGNNILNISFKGVGTVIISVTAIAAIVLIVYILAGNRTHEVSVELSEEKFKAQPAAVTEYQPYELTEEQKLLNSQNLSDKYSIQEDYAGNEKNTGDVTASVTYSESASSPLPALQNRPSYKESDASDQAYVLQNDHAQFRNTSDQFSYHKNDSDAHELQKQISDNVLSVSENSDSEEQVQSTEKTGETLPDQIVIPVHRSHDSDNPYIDSLPNIFIDNAVASPGGNASVKISLKGFPDDIDDVYMGISNPCVLDHAELKVKYDEGLIFNEADFFGNSDCTCSAEGNGTLNIYLDMKGKSDLEFELRFTVPEVINDISAYHVFIPENSAKIVYPSTVGIRERWYENYNRCGEIKVDQ